MDVRTLDVGPQIHWTKIHMGLEGPPQILSKVHVITEPYAIWIRD